MRLQVCGDGQLKLGNKVFTGDMDGTQTTVNQATCRTRCHERKETLVIHDSPEEGNSFINAVTGSGTEIRFFFLLVQDLSRLKFNLIKE